MGVGTLKEEFDLHRCPLRPARPAFGRRPTGPARRALASEPAYHGEFYDFEGFVVDPCAVQEHVPLWVGGRTLRSLRRGATLADGWCPFTVSPAQAAEWLRTVEIPAGFDVVLPPTARLDPINEPGRTQEILAETEAYGATIVSVVPARGTLDEYLEYLESLTTITEGSRRGDPGYRTSVRGGRVAEPPDRRHVRDGLGVRLRVDGEDLGLDRPTDGSLQVDFGLGKYHNRGVIDGFGGISRGREQWTVRGSRELAVGARKRRRSARSSTRSSNRCGRSGSGSSRTTSSRSPSMWCSPV